MKQTDILFTPLALPPLELSLSEVQEFGKIQTSEQTFYQRFCKTVMLRRAINSNNTSVYNFYERDLIWEWTDVARKHFPQVIAWVETNLPLSHITLITFVAPKLVREVPPHRDYPINFLPDFVKQNEPYAYRISLGNTLNSFFVCDKQGITTEELEEGKYLFGNLPKTSNSWIMNTSACFHGTLSRPDKETLFICGIADEVRHSKLILQSIEQYREYVLTKSQLAESKNKLSEIYKNPWTGLLDRHPELNGLGMNK